MDKKILQQVAAEQYAFIKNLASGIPREELPAVLADVPLPHSVVIAGIRRAGKSTLLRQIMASSEAEWYYFNFEDERLIAFSAADFNLLYETFAELYGERKIFFFDEIQNVAGWERFVRRMTDRGYKFYITGSNASLLSRELGTKLTGRYLSHDLYPFSFREYLRFHHVAFAQGDLLHTSKRAALKRRFNSYLVEGGMPEYLTYKTPETLKKVYNDILYRDIIVRYDLREEKAFREMAFYLLSNISALFSYNALKKAFGLGSMNTAKSYVEYMENSFLFSTLHSYSDSAKRQAMSPKKIYCIDNGLARTVGFHFSDNKGAFLENLVFLELKRRGKEIYYYKTKEGFEVDFLIRKDGKSLALIGVSWSNANEKTKQRELRSLQSAMKELRIKNATLLTDGETETVKLKEGTVSVMPVYEWLLSGIEK